MIGKWIKSKMPDTWECSKCGWEIYSENEKTNYCPSCGDDKQDREQYTRAEVIMLNMRELIDNYNEYKDDPDIYWWCDEYGGYLTDMIDCHVVFKGEPPCLLDERGIDISPDTSEERIKRDEACAECKAIWLMGVYE